MIVLLSCRLLVLGAALQYSLDLDKPCQQQMGHSAGQGFPEVTHLPVLLA